MQLGGRQPVTRTRQARRRDDERGVLMVVALTVATVVLLLTTAAITQTINGVMQSGIANKQVTSTDAAEAGIQYEVSQINAQVAAAASSAGPYSFACPSGATAVSSSTTATYTVRYSSATGTPGSVPAMPALQSCTGGGVALTGGTYYWLQSLGAASASATGLATRSVLGLVYVAAGTTYGPMTAFSQAIFGATGVSGSGNTTVSSTNNSANVYSAGPLACTNTTIFSGNVFAYGGLTSGTGACSISGNFYNHGSLSLTDGTYSGNLTSVGDVTTQGGTTIGKNVYVTGNASLVGNGIGSSSSSANVYVNGDVTIGGGQTVYGNIYATGNVDINNGHVNGTIESTGGNVTYEQGSQSGRAYVSAGHSCTAGATSCSVGSMPGDYPPSSTFPTASTLPAAPGFPSLTFSQPAWQGAGYRVVTTNNCSPPSNGTFVSNSVADYLHSMTMTGAPPTVIVTSCRVTWGTSMWPETGTINLYNNLAIFADGGIAFGTDFNGFTAASGTPNLYLMVPSDYAGRSSSGASCASGGAAVAGGHDISFGSQLSDGNVHDFLYTPGSICNSGSAGLTGKIYADQGINLGTTYAQTFYDIDPFGQTSGGGGNGSSTPGALNVEWVRNS